MTKKNIEKKDENAVKRGIKINSIRTLKGISRRGLAKKLIISDTALANIENGETKSLSIELGLKIAKELGIPFNELFEIEVFTDSDEISKLKAENEKLKYQISELKSEQLKDKKILLDSLQSHNILYDFAYSLYHNTEEFDKARRKAAKETNNVIDMVEYQTKLMPFDRDNAESIIEYISKNFIWNPKN